MSNMHFSKRLVLLMGVFVCQLSISGSLNGQLLFNEIMASNASTLEDQFNDFPDWIELYNSGESTLLLSDFWLTDDSLEMKKWRLPEIDIPPEAYFLVFASGRDIPSSLAYWHTIINTGDKWRYLVPDAPVGENWKTSLDYTSGWNNGSSGIGYSDNDDSTIISTTLSLFMQKEFQVTDASSLTDAVLFMDYDDGFIAYLNGTEVARSATMGVSGTSFNYNQASSGQHEALMYNGSPPEAFFLTEYIHLIQEGSNILAIQVHNTSIGSSDMSANPFLLLGYSTIRDDLPYGNPYVTVEDRFPHANFKIRSAGEYLYLSHNNGDTIDIFNKVILPTDFSYGRVPGHSELFGYYNDPTPGFENGIDYFTEYFTDSVSFSSNAQDWDPQQLITLTSDQPEDIIYYTLDGSVPNQNSQIYSNPIMIDNTTVIRARISREGNLPGPVSTRTIFTDQGHSLPVVSVSMNPDDLWDYNTGIYEMGPNASSDNPHFGANFWQDWEKPAHVEIRDRESNKIISQDVGTKIFGAWSRARPQKSMSFFARSSYGDGSFSYPLFSSKPIMEYENFVLRNGGNDYQMSMMRDALSAYVSSQLGVDHQAYEPYVMYLNGEYWGMMNMREKINEHFIAGNHHVHDEDVNLLEGNSMLIHGSANSYNELIRFLSDNSMQNEQNYEDAGLLMDIDNFINFWALNVYIDNKDWPGNNNKFWSLNVPGSKFRWISFDTDFGYSIYNTGAYTYNTLEFSMSEGESTWANPDWATLIARKMEGNDEFKRQFINRFADLMNYYYHPDYIFPVIDSFETKIEDDVQANFSRWEGSVSYWQNHLNRIRTYLEERPDYMRSHIIERYDLSGTEELSINTNIESAGHIRLNGIKKLKVPFNGIYFTDVPVELEAIPLPGYRFAGWEGSISSAESSVSYDMSGPGTITAIFEPFEYQYKIVINEINYASSAEKNISDWIELYNHSDGPVNLKGWSLWDETSGNEFLIDENIILQPGEYFVFSRSRPDFKRFYPEMHQLWGDLNFGLDNVSDGIALVDALGAVHDQVQYQSSDPWPDEANGLGYTLELMDPDLDNSDATSWKASKFITGTPGNKNSQSTVNDEKRITNQLLPEFKIYPSPFHSYTDIYFALDKEDHVSISVYDIAGQLVKVFPNELFKRGRHTIRWVPDPGLRAGVYLVRYKSSIRTHTIKVVYR